MMSRKKLAQELDLKAADAICAEIEAKKLRRIENGRKASVKSEEVFNPMAESRRKRNARAQKAADTRKRIVLEKAKGKMPPGTPALVIVPRITVQVTGHDEGVTSWHHGDALLDVHVNRGTTTSAFSTRFALAQKLRELASFFSGLHDDIDGNVTILVLRNRQA